MLGKSLKKLLWTKEFGEQIKKKKKTEPHYQTQQLLNTEWSLNNHAAVKYLIQ